MLAADEARQGERERLTVHPLQAEHLDVIGASHGAIGVDEAGAGPGIGRIIHVDRRRRCRGVQEFDIQGGLDIRTRCGVPAIDSDVGEVWWLDAKASGRRGDVRVNVWYQFHQRRSHPLSVQRGGGEGGEVVCLSQIGPAVANGRRGDGWPRGPDCRGGVILPRAPGDRTGRRLDPRAERYGPLAHAHDALYQGCERRREHRRANRSIPGVAAQAVFPDLGLKCGLHLPHVPVDI